MSDEKKSGICSAEASSKRPPATPPMPLPPPHGASPERLAQYERDRRAWDDDKRATASAPTDEVKKARARLHMMTVDKGDTWDLSPKDKAAVRLVLGSASAPVDQELARLRAGMRQIAHCRSPNPCHTCMAIARGTVEPVSSNASPRGYVVTLCDTSGLGGDYRELTVRRDGIVVRAETDGGEPEDQSFYRDWKWVPDALREAYAFGLEDAPRRRVPGDLKCPDCGEPLVCSFHVSRPGSASSLEREHEADRQRWQRVLTSIYEELKGNRISAAVTRLELFRWDATPCARLTREEAEQETPPGEPTTFAELAAREFQRINDPRACARPAGVTEESETAQRTVDEMMREAATPNAGVTRTLDPTRTHGQRFVGPDWQPDAPSSCAASDDERVAVVLAPGGMQERRVRRMLADVRRETIEACAVRAEESAANFLYRASRLRDVPLGNVLANENQAAHYDVMATGAKRTAERIRAGQFTHVDSKEKP